MRDAHSRPAAKRSPARWSQAKNEPGYRKTHRGEQKWRHLADSHANGEEGAPYKKMIAKANSVFHVGTMGASCHNKVCIQ